MVFTPDRLVNHVAISHVEPEECPVGRQAEEEDQEEGPRNRVPHPYPLGLEVPGAEVPLQSGVDNRLGAARDLEK